ncbi:MAG TPA: sigma factor-like helix-turn-helix DNA-binding protein [Solirubrobacteraceae bacterium]
MPAPTYEADTVRAGALPEPAAVDELWDVHGPPAFAFCHRLLGDAGAAADAAQDAFLLAHAERQRPGHPRAPFRVALLGAARTTSFDLIGRPRPAAARTRGALSAATARLRPQQRAALALAGLEGLSHADIATVLGIAPERVAALLARARLRLHDELYGTALAATAVRSPDCEDVLPVLAAGVDGELDPAEAAWADPHLERCPTCQRTIRALRDAATTYAAWSPAAAPSWLRAATLAEIGEQEPAPAAAPRPARAATLVSATLVTAASAALLVGSVRSLRPAEVSLGGARLSDAAHSVQMAAIAKAPLVGPRHRPTRAEDAAPGRLGARVPAAVPPRTTLSPPQAVPPVPARRHHSVRGPERKRRAPSTVPAAAIEAPEPAGAQTPAEVPAPSSSSTAAAPAGASTTPVAAAAAAPAGPPTGATATPPPPAPAADDQDGAPTPCGRGDARDG